MILYNINAIAVNSILINFRYLNIGIQYGKREGISVVQSGCLQRHRGFMGCVKQSKVIKKQPFKTSKVRFWIFLIFAKRKAATCLALQR
jgi:hypothetical protein